LSGRSLCDELITRPEESYRLCCVVVCDLETSRIGAPYIYDISSLRVKSSVVFVASNVETCPLLRNYAAYSGNSLRTFRESLPVPSSRV